MIPAPTLHMHTRYGTKYALFAQHTCIRDSINFVLLGFYMCFEGKIGNAFNRDRQCVLLPLTEKINRKVNSARRTETLHHKANE